MPEPEIDSVQSEASQPSVDSEALGLTVATILDLPDAERRLINWMRRRATDATAAEMMEYLNLDEAEVLALLEKLVLQGFILKHDEENEPGYRVCMASMRSRRSPKSFDFLLFNKP